MVSKHASSVTQGGRRANRTLADLVPATMVCLIKVVAVLVVGSYSIVATATDCGSKDMDRNTPAQFRLAIRNGDGWTLFDQQEEGTLETLGSELCLAWEAPPDRKNQMIYVSTRYRDHQPLSIYRNASSPPFFFSWLSDWRGPTLNPKLFLQFHRTSACKNDENPDVWDTLCRWHRTSFWHVELESYDLVGGALDGAVGLDDAIPQLHGSHRLLVISGGRSKKSWIPFTSKIQRPGRLFVSVSYSGDDEPFVYEYVLNTKRRRVR